MKATETNPSEDLQAIRDIMERSSKFLSLSGLAGIFAGVCALAGAVFAWFLIFDSDALLFNEFLGGGPSGSQLLFPLIADALVVLIFALGGAVYFSQRKARKAGHPVWNTSTRQMLLHLMIPLVTGSLMILILVFRESYETIPGMMLIFYGLALVSAGKFTLGEIHYLGLTILFLGILALVFIQYSLLLWATGFGLMHILYGTVMFYRHER